MKQGPPQNVRARLPKPVCDRVAFSLVELLVVIAIIGLLAALILSATSKAKAKATNIQCISNLKQVGIGMELEMDDHDGAVPTRLDTYTVDTTIEPYIYPKGMPANGGAFNCPAADTNKTSSLGASLGSYGLLSYGLNYGCSWTRGPIKITEVPHPTLRVYTLECNKQAMTLYQNTPDRYAPRHTGQRTPNNGNGESGNMLFLDGHVESRSMSMNPILTTDWYELGTTTTIYQ